MSDCIGSLFSGYGGLDMAVQSVVGGRVAWVSDIEPGPSRILATHHPDIPNLGDVTAIDWKSVEPVDVICGGSPCQDLSMAGRRAGMRPGTRSGLWESMLAAITTIRPRLVVWENVLGALSADAFTLCDLESESRHLGSPGERHPPLRALGRVLGDLAGAGFDAQWISLRASDVGACHRRTRVFLIAHPQGEPWRSDIRECGIGGDPDGAARDEWRQPAAGETPVGRARADARGSDRAPVSHLLPTPTQRDFKDHRIARNPKRPEDIDTLSRALTLLPTPMTGDADKAPFKPRRSPGQWYLTQQIAALPIAERPDGHRSANFADGCTTFRDAIGRDWWGEFAPAIVRWEEVTGRPVPEPTEQGRTGQRLSARFVEWMMGLPGGWVTAVDISRTAQLRALGNGVVPQQAAAAIRTMLTNTDAMEVAA
ncbi:DNA cytosine methyltransferase [Propionibacterium freudenreichii]